MTERQLFDPETTTAAVCKACGATREPGEQKAPTCTVDRDRQAGTAEYRRRPAGCLNQIDNRHQGIPY